MLPISLDSVHGKSRGYGICIESMVLPDLHLVINFISSVKTKYLVYSKYNEIAQGKGTEKTSVLYFRERAEDLSFPLFFLLPRPTESRYFA